MVDIIKADEIDVVEVIKEVTELDVVNHPVTVIEYFKGLKGDDGVSPTLDSDLVDIGNLSPADGDTLYRSGGHWLTRSLAALKTALGLTGTNSGDQDLSGLRPALVTADVAVDTTAGTASNTDYVYNFTVTGKTLTIPTPVGRKNMYIVRCATGTTNITAPAGLIEDGTTLPIYSGESVDLVSINGMWRVV